MHPDDILAWIELGEQMERLRNPKPQILNPEVIEVICTCGIESAGLGGEHSKWCDKMLTNDQRAMRDEDDKNVR